MLSFHAHLKIFLATAPCDLRMNFTGLWNAAQEKLGEDPKSGALFVFSNRRHNRIKILYFDGTGVCILTNRLVSHCPLEAMWKTSLSVSPALRATGRSGNRRGSIGHARRSAALMDRDEAFRPGCLIPPFAMKCANSRDRLLRCRPCSISLICLNSMTSGR